MASSQIGKNIIRHTQTEIRKHCSTVESKAHQGDAKGFQQLVTIYYSHTV